VNRAERRRAARAEARGRSFHLDGDEVCGRCGRHLDDGPPDAPTMSVEISPGQILYACGWCAPDLHRLVLGLTS
jgi:hypothetical protein